MDLRGFTLILLHGNSAVQLRGFTLIYLRGNSIGTDGRRTTTQCLSHSITAVTNPNAMNLRGNSIGTDGRRTTMTTTTTHFKSFQSIDPFLLFATGLLSVVRQSKNN